MLQHELVALVSKSKTEAEKEAIMINNELIANIQDQYDSSTCFTDVCLNDLQTMKRTCVCMALRLLSCCSVFPLPSFFSFLFLTSVQSYFSRSQCYCNRILSLNQPGLRSRPEVFSGVIENEQCESCRKHTARNKACDR